MILVAALVIASCGDGSTTTGPTLAAGVLAGTWNGTLTLRVSNQPATTSATTWTFSTIVATGGLSFDTR